MEKEISDKLYRELLGRINNINEVVANNIEIGACKNVLGCLLFDLEQHLIWNHHGKVEIEEKNSEIDGDN
jgi:hypothetical protein